MLCRSFDLTTPGKSYLLWAVSSFFGQPSQRGQSPVEHRGTFVRPFVRPSVWAEFGSKRADVRPKASWGLEWADLRLERAGLRLGRP